MPLVPEPPTPEPAGPTPLVSVVIATYGRPLALTRAIRSALSQTLSDLEVVVAVERDDADSAAAVAAIGDPRVRHVVNPRRGGPGPARDFGAALSKGQWVAFLDDDDEWLPPKLERQLAAAEGDERTIVTCQSFVVGSDGVVVKPARPFSGDRALNEWLFDRRSWWGGADAMLQTSSRLAPCSACSASARSSMRNGNWRSGRCSGTATGSPPWPSRW